MSRAVCRGLGMTQHAKCLRSWQRSHFRLILSSSATCQSVPSSVTMSSAPAISAPECLFHPLDFPHKTLMGPGPSNAPPRVLGACAMPLLGHLHPEFTQIMDQVKQGIQYAFQTQNEWTFAISGTGHAAMEAVAANLLETGDMALVCQNGIWGQRFADMAERNGSLVQKVLRPMGEVFSLQEVEEALKTHRPVLMFITHGESSGGTAQPLQGLGPLCHRYNCLLVVDSVAAMGGVPLFMDKWEIDCLYSGSQKVLGAPPGTAPISFSDRAKQRIQSRSSKVRSYYFDANELANYWGCDDGPRRYHHTGPISSVYALREGLARLAEIGLEKSWANHKECSQQLYQGLEKLGLSLCVRDPAVRNPCVTTIQVPDGVAWKDVVDYAMKNYRVEISGGLGELAGKVWRIGIMGYNCTPDNVRLVLRALREALVSCGHSLP
ncbi:alanine--glyoxylate aminotransferase-like [Babylonia areolata]|uniref:alanine--glyoxylate aminotransferase-like n=1 Tax=Babylonia areolata TaxID=304850 RepID=UPI003FD4E7AC